MSETTRDIVVIGASAGSVPALLKLAESLPANFPAAVFIVLHVGANASVLPSLLRARGLNPAHHAIDGEPIKPGHLYVAPPDRHLLLEKDRLRLSSGPKEHHTRPAIDPLFRSAALNYGNRVIGVVLSGRYDDGTAGLQAIKACGGLAVVQDPDDAEESSMPASALANVAVDRRVTAARLAEILVDLVRRPSITEQASADPNLKSEHDVSVQEGGPMQKLDSIGRPSKFVCPDCDGVLWELTESKPLRFRCHTGHAYTLRSLSYTQAVKSEDTLWAAIRSLHERTALQALLAEGYLESGEMKLAKRHRDGADQFQDRADALYRLITDRQVIRDGYDDA